MSQLRAFLASFKPSNTERPIMMSLLLGGMLYVLILLAGVLYLLLGGPVPGVGAGG